MKTYLSQSVTINAAGPQDTLGNNTEGPVSCMAIRHQSFLLHMALTVLPRSLNVQPFTGSLPAAMYQHEPQSFSSSKQID